jgi:hypothetical protein
MCNPVWSLENKAHDIEQAFFRHDFPSSRMSAHELGILLEHTKQQLGQSCRGASAVPVVNAAEGRIENLFGAIYGESERLGECFGEQRLETTQESIATIRFLLAKLGKRLRDV